MVVSKASCILRCNGDIVSAELLQRFDDSAMQGVEETLGGAISDDSWTQATPGVDAAGLGLKEASVVARTAFLASRIVQAMVRSREKQGSGLLPCDEHA